MQIHMLAVALPLLTPLALALTPAQWQVTNLYSFSPSGRPGTSPDYYIRVNISNPDPRPDAPGVVLCTSIWQYPDVPYNKISDCQIVDSVNQTADGDATNTHAHGDTWAWTLEPLEVVTDDFHFATTNVNLRWRAARINSNSGSAKARGVRVLTGVGHFEVGDNMTGLCAASGFCVWNLKPEKAPVLVDVESVVCHGTVEEALHNINCDQV